MEWRAFVKTLTCKISKLALLLSFLAALPINLSTLGKICHFCFSSHSTGTSWESIYHKVGRRHIVRAARVTHPSANIRPNLSFWGIHGCFFGQNLKLLCDVGSILVLPYRETTKAQFPFDFCDRQFGPILGPKWPNGYLRAKTFVFGPQSVILMEWIF